MKTYLILFVVLISPRLFATDLECSQLFSPPVAVAAPKISNFRSQFVAKLAAQKQTIAARLKIIRIRGALRATEIAYVRARVDSLIASLSETPAQPEANLELFLIDNFLKFKEFGEHAAPRMTIDEDRDFMVEVASSAIYVFQHLEIVPLPEDEYDLFMAQYPILLERADNLLAMMEMTRDNQEFNETNLDMRMITIYFQNMSHRFNRIN